MKMTVAEIAEKLGGTLKGSGSAEIEGIAGLRDAGSSEISFLSNTRYAAAVSETGAAAVIVDEEWGGESNTPLICVKDVEAASAEVASWLAPPPVVPEPGFHATAIIADDVQIGKNVSIGPYCVLEAGVVLGEKTVILAGCYIGHEAVIGSDCTLYAHVSVRERTRIGSRTIVHSGTVIGSDGYGYVPEETDGKLVVRKIPQTGIVEIGDDVEIGANVTIDRARFGTTRIGNSVKIDNLVHVAHNVTIGDYTGIVAQAGISGSVAIGSRVIVWGQAGLSGHLSVGDGAVVGAQAGVTKDVAAGSHVSGYPAMPHKKAAETHANLMRVPHLKARVAKLEERIRELEGENRASEG